MKTKEPGSPKGEMKVIGNRGSLGPIEEARGLQESVVRLRAVGVAPRGVYRFRSFEEADRWLMRQMASLHARRASKTSNESARVSSEREPSTY